MNERIYEESDDEGSNTVHRKRSTDNVNILRSVGSSDIHWYDADDGYKLDKPKVKVENLWGRTLMLWLIILLPCAIAFTK